MELGRLKLHPRAAKRPRRNLGTRLLLVHGARPGRWPKASVFPTDLEPEVVDSADPQPFRNHAAGAYREHQLCYQPDRPILRGATLSASSSTVTFCRRHRLRQVHARVMLLRLYNPDGAVFINDVELSQISTQDVRANISTPCSRIFFSPPVSLRTFAMACAMLMTRR